MSEPHTLNALFDAAVQRFAGRPCIEFLGRRWTYAQIADLVARVCGGLQGIGVRAGDRVGLCLPNSVHYVVAYYAVLRAGAVVVNCNPLSPAPELAVQARDAGIGVMVSTDLRPVLGRVLEVLTQGTITAVVACPFASGLGVAKRVGFSLRKRAMLTPIPAGVARWQDLRRGPPVAAASVGPNDLAVLQYTGGTTGTPKGAMLTHGNLAANAAQARAWIPDSRPGAECVLGVLPLFHAFAMTAVLNASFGWGAEIVLLPRFEIAPLLAALRRCRPTMIHGVPTLFRAILDECTPSRDLTSVRVCICGGAPLPHALQRDFEAAAGCRLVEGYGLTEASPFCLCNPVSTPGRNGTVGLPLDGVEVEIRALDDPARVQPVGERGEIWVRGPNVMRGYWRRPAETAATLTPEGWLRTGDVGTVDADGFVTLVDRIKDLIICAGFKVYPRTVEEALYQHPDVVAAVAVGMPDAYRGESVAAFVQVSTGSSATEASLWTFLADRLSPIELPRRIEIRHELPRTAVGKLSRKELRAELNG